MGQIEVHEGGADDGGIGEEGEDPHLAATAQAQQRQHLATSASRRCPRARSYWAPGHLGLAIVASQRGDRATAGNAYRRVLEIEPGHRLARQGLEALGGE